MMRRHRQQYGDSRRKGGRGRSKWAKGEQMGMEGDWTLGGGHVGAVCRRWFVGVHTQDLHGYVNRHPNKFNKKKINIKIKIEKQKHFKFLNVWAVTSHFFLLLPRDANLGQPLTGQPPLSDIFSKYLGTHRFALTQWP